VDVVDYNILRDTAYLYADLDGVLFSEAVLDHLFINWPIEAARIDVRIDEACSFEIFRSKMIEILES
jgi:dihydrofolate reductase